MSLTLRASVTAIQKFRVDCRQKSSKASGKIDFCAPWGFELAGSCAAAENFSSQLNSQHLAMAKDLGTTGQLHSSVSLS